MNKGSERMNNVIGIDVSKTTLDCAWLRDLESGKAKTKIWTNNSGGHKRLIEWATHNLGVGLSEIVFVMEATGVYHEALAYFLHGAGAQVVVTNPAQVRDYAKSLAIRSKNDRKDSLVLARYGLTQPWRTWQPEAPEVRELRALLARLEALEKDLQREQNRMEKAQVSAASSQVMASIQRSLEALKTEKQRLERLIDDHIDRHPQLKQDAELLQSIPAIGPVLMRYMLALYHARSFRRARQMAAYLGLNPVEHTSGSSVRGRPRLSKTGPASLRAKLYLPAVVATRHNPQAKALYERLIARGKSKMTALGAVMRKLVHLCFGVLKHQQAYSPTAA
jgi:transposase